MIRLPRRLKAAVLLSPLFRTTHRLLLGDRGAIFMLHRFRDDPDEGSAHSPHQLDRLLALLTRGERRVLPLADLLERVRHERSIPAGAVAFTVDDGYRDFYTTALPVFEKHDCPVTVFLTTGFIDGELWMWWDQLEVVLSEAPTSHSLELPETGRRYAWSDVDERQRARSELVEDLQLMDTAHRSRALDRLASRFGAPITEDAPAPYRPMTWEQVRSGADRGATFAPHTVSHPVLRYESDRRVRTEIERSWTRLQDETGTAVPCFAYPNGRFDERAVDATREAGLLGALTCEQAYVRVGPEPGSERTDPYRLPRFPMTSHLADSLEVTSGAARLRRLTGSAFVRS